MALPDRGYTILLSHLHKPSSTLPLESLQSLIAHYLAHSPATTTTPLSATITSSPLFRPFSHAKLTALTTAFRHAVHVKLKMLEEEPSSLFSRGLKPRMEDWAKNVVRGLSGGQGTMRLVGAGGVLLGLDDVKEKLGVKEDRGGARGKAEDEVVVALAEIMDIYAGTRVDGWEKEFHPETESGEVDVVSLALTFSCQFLPHVLSERLKALPLSALSSILMSSIESVFLWGTFLTELPSSSWINAEGKLTMSTRKGSARPSFPYEDSTSPQHLSACSVTLRTLTASPLYASIAALSNIFSRIISILVVSHPREGWITMAEVLDRLQSISTKVENDWAQSALAQIQDDNDIAADSRELIASLWSVLKTLLFTTIMLSQTCLSATVYNAPPSSSRLLGNTSSTSPSYPTPSSLALTTLHTLSHFSFIISQFGGVTSTSGGGFSELKRTFYTALDVVSADARTSDEFVRVIGAEGIYPTPSSDAHPTVRAFDTSKQAFCLACIEQLIPVLSLATIEKYVFPLCLPHLNGPSQRETYESAHSVVLATFASHAQKQSNGGSTGRMTDQSGHEVRFVEKIVPFYAQCLLDNSAEGKMSTAQLRIAYTALVGSAAVSSSALAQFCIAVLLEKIDRLSAPVPNQSGNDDRIAQLHRLHLTLISIISALPISLLADALDSIGRIISSALPADAGGEHRQELIDALFKEILERVGDREKEFAMHWWEDNRRILRMHVKEVAVHGRASTEKSDGETVTLCRL